MASNLDHESSDSDGESFTETSTLLGYASKEPTEDTISHLGGTPQWLDDTPPPGSFAHCRTCRQPMTLLLQLNGDLPDRFPGHERRLYIFSCGRKPCRRKPDSIRAVRGTKADRSHELKKTPRTEEPSSVQREEQKPARIGESLFGVAATKSPGSSGGAVNPFATGKTAAAMVNPFASKTAPPTAETQATAPAPVPLEESFADKVRLSSPDSTSTAGEEVPSEPWPPESAFPRAYPHYHLDADYETLDKPSAPGVPAQAQLDPDFDVPGSSSGGGGDGKEDAAAFESSLDKTFQRFAERMQQNPEQVLRYEFGGVPLLYSKDDAVGKALGGGAVVDANAKVKTVGRGAGKGFPRCGTCGAERVFEVQLTPEAITVLEVEEEGVVVGQGGKLEATGMQWGTVIMAVCSADCVPRATGDGKVGYVEEWAGIQFEELVER